MKIAYAGTPEFARVALAALLAAGHTVGLVLTQPDRPAGRGLKLQPSPVKRLALDSGLPLAQPRSLRLEGKYQDDAAAARVALQQAGPDVMVVAAYGLILPQWVLALPRLGCINIHGSLLPRWRGAAPVQRAIEAGDTETGITLMQMDAGLDTGPMLMSAATAISAVDTSATLHARLAGIGVQQVVQGLALLEQGRLAPQAQPAAGATYARKIEKAEAAIDWHEPAATLERRIRAFDPFPGCSTELGGLRVKVWRACVVPGAGTPGQVLCAAEGRLVVACGAAALALLDLQLAGGRRIAAGEFLQHHPLAVG